MKSSDKLVNLSPEYWPQDVRERVEAQESRSWLAVRNRTISGNHSLISATASPIALEAGIIALGKGGTAADAAAVIALTQVATQLGSVVSYAGIMSSVYYDATSKKVVSLDAGFNSYRNENDPLSIPPCVKGDLEQHQQQLGRQTLVPGFMAGIEALHQRFGNLPFACLFQPAVWYAERGIKINSWLEHYFHSRQKDLSRTKEGREFLQQAGNDLPATGDVFVQQKLAETLRLTGREGSRVFYSGLWAQHFIDQVQLEGGKVTKEDLVDYRAAWTKPETTEVFGHKIYCAGLPNQIAYKLFPSLHLSEELEIEKRANYWQDPLVLRDLQRIFDITDFAPSLFPSIKNFFESQGIDCSAAAQLSRKYAAAIAPHLEKLWNPRPSPVSNHSDSIVVIDQFGNIAAVTHSINTHIWGDTGIVVDGVPLPDAAGFQQSRLSSVKPGERLPHEMPQIICFRDDSPVLATAAIGASMIPETLRMIIGVIGKGMTIDVMQAAAPLINNYMHLQNITRVPERGVVVPADWYSLDFQKHLSELVEKVHLLDKSETLVSRGTVSAAFIDTNGELHSAESKGMLNFVRAI